MELGYETDYCSLFKPSQIAIYGELIYMFFTSKFFQSSILNVFNSTYINESEIDVFIHFF